jgi:hypothetical protein
MKIDSLECIEAPLRLGVIIIRRLWPRGRPVAPGMERVRT